MFAYREPNWDAKTRALTQLVHATIPGPGFHTPTLTDATLFNHVPPQRPEFWGALNGEYAISRPSHAEFIQMLQAAARACNVKTNQPPQHAPVSVGFHSESAALAAGGPFVHVEMTACNEVWRLSTDDWARIMLHVAYHGKHAAGVKNSVFPACVWRILQCCTRDLRGVHDMVAGPDVTWACLPSDAFFKSTQNKMRQAQIFVFLAVKAFTLNNAQRFQLRGIWQQVLSLMRTESLILPTHFGVAARLPTLSSAIEASRFLLDALHQMVESVGMYLRKRLYGEENDGVAYDNLWDSAGTLALVGPRLTHTRHIFRALPSEPTTALVVAHELLRTLQVTHTGLLCTGPLCTFHALSVRDAGRVGQAARGCGLGEGHGRHTGRLGRVQVHG